MPDPGSEQSPQRSPGESIGGLSHSFGARVLELDGIRGTTILPVLLYDLFGYTMIYRPVIAIRQFNMICAAGVLW
jgi:hypothetical protein